MEIILLIIIICIVYIVNDFIKERIKKYKERIRNEVVFDIQKEKNIEQIISKYKGKISYIKTYNLSSFYEQIIPSDDIKKVGFFGDFLNECPKCKNGRQVVKRSSYGSFIGCSEYPKCNYTEDVKKNKERYKESINKQIMTDLEKAYL